MKTDISQEKLKHGKLEKFFRILLLILLVLSAIYVTSFRADTPYDPQTIHLLANLNAERVDRQAVDFELLDLDGEMHSLEEFRGELVFLNFWASWCPPCREEMPSLVRLAQSYEGEGFTVVTVSLDNDLEELTEFLNTSQIPHDSMLILRDPEGEIARSYGTLLLPETHLIDQRGQIVARFQNAYNWEAPHIRNLLERLLQHSWQYK